MEKAPKTAEIQPVSESNFQIMKFRLHHSLLGARPHFFRSVFPQPVKRAPELKVNAITQAEFLTLLRSKS